MINGSQLRDAIVSAAYTIANQKQKVDELNVFPVPDGDTGTNMSMTIGAATRELELLKEPTVSETAKVAASALLRGARGNSGVILSLLFRGFSKGMKGKVEATGVDFAEALSEGVAAAYKAVMKPTEGTILTVAREAAEKAQEVANQTNDALTVFRAIVAQAEETLLKTPEMLPVLKKAGVVDAGGKGFTVIFGAMLAVFEGGPVARPEAQAAAAAPEAPKPRRSAVAEASGDIKNTYCTEFIVEKAPNAEDALKLRAYLESIGDSVVVVDDETIIKVHVHTNHPGDALESGLKFGSLTKMKIENMKEQHSAQVEEAEQKEEDSSYVPVDPLRLCRRSGRTGRQLPLHRFRRQQRSHRRPDHESQHRRHPPCDPCHPRPDRFCPPQQQKHHHGGGTGREAGRPPGLRAPDGQHPPRHLRHAGL